MDFTASKGVACMMCLMMVSCFSNRENQDTIPRTHLVEINGFEFNPAYVQAIVGDTIRWVNKDIVPHTATEVSERWHSSELKLEGEWWQVIKQSADYYCEYHPSMKGRIEIADTSHE